MTSGFSFSFNNFSTLTTTWDLNLEIWPPFKLAANPELKVHGKKPGKKEMAGSDVILLWVQQQRFGIGNALIILTGC
jgi:hypothetical protein